MNRREKQLKLNRLLFDAIYYSDIDLVYSLIFQGAQTEYCNSVGNRCIHVAAHTGNKQLLSIVLKASTDHTAVVNDRGENKNTPLHYAVTASAATEEVIEAVWFLLKQGADATLCNAKKMSPRDLCLIDEENETKREVLKIFDQWTIKKYSKLFHRPSSRDGKQEEEAREAPLTQGSEREVIKEQLETSTKKEHEVTQFLKEFIENKMEKDMVKAATKKEEMSPDFLMKNPSENKEASPTAIESVHADSEEQQQSMSSPKTDINNATGRSKALLGEQTTSKTDVPVLEKFFTVNDKAIQNSALEETSIDKAQKDSTVVEIDGLKLKLDETEIQNPVLFSGVTYVEDETPSVASINKSNTVADSSEEQSTGDTNFSKQHPKVSSKVEVDLSVEQMEPSDGLGLLLENNYSQFKKLLTEPNSEVQQVIANVTSRETVPMYPTVIDMNPSGAAAKAGVKIKDEILSVNDVKLADTESIDVVYRIVKEQLQGSCQRNQPLRLKVRRQIREES